MRVSPAGSIVHDDASHSCVTALPTEIDMPAILEGLLMRR